MSKLNSAERKEIPSSKLSPEAAAKIRAKANKVLGK
jgi:hypothetical protein